MMSVFYIVCADEQQIELLHIMEINILLVSHFDRKFGFITYSAFLGKYILLGQLYVGFQLPVRKMRNNTFCFANSIFGILW
ncbi:hypothetical protein Lalb_Chr12g0204681 [Lupinus albus]|uniref:Uncharacterized protein n=1 Tax=Lupinus albus TaxID=3870 RepID=A0A6A4PN32_LUPAL|nr:hypothetical protein Lalb_Chr12g0204681 [Lupinus albus]